jgi:hypothetical protein
MNRRNRLWFGFGGLWFADGLLQAQPAMFTQQFVTNVLQPVAQGQPAWLTGLLATAAALWQSHGVAANLAAVLVELAIGVLFILGRERFWGRVALIASIGWGLVIWIFGEGLGGVLASPPSAVTGAPGAVLAYVVAALLLLLSSKRWQGGTVVRWTRRGLGVFWLLAALTQAWPGTGYWTADGFGWTLQSAASQPQPAVISTGVVDVASLIVRQPILANALFVTIMLVLGSAFLADVAGWWAYGLAFAWLGFSWWIGQDFGAIFSGTGTDPGLALPLALLTFAVAPGLRSRRTAAAVIGIGQIGRGPTPVRPVLVAVSALGRTARWESRTGKLH